MDYDPDFTGGAQTAFVQQARAFLDAGVKVSVIIPLLLRPSMPSDCVVRCTNWWSSRSGCAMQRLRVRQWRRRHPRPGT